MSIRFRLGFQAEHHIFHIFQRFWRSTWVKIRSDKDMWVGKKKCQCVIRLSFVESICFSFVRSFVFTAYDFHISRALKRAFECAACARARLYSCSFLTFRKLCLNNICKRSAWIFILILHWHRATVVCSAQFQLCNNNTHTHKHTQFDRLWLKGRHAKGWSRSEM